MLRCGRSYAADHHEGAHVAGLGQEIAAARAEQELARTAGRRPSRTPRWCAAPSVSASTLAMPTAPPHRLRLGGSVPTVEAMTVPMSMARRKSRLVPQRLLQLDQAVAQLEHCRRHAHAHRPPPTFGRAGRPPARSGRRAGPHSTRRSSRWRARNSWTMASIAVRSPLSDGRCATVVQFGSLMTPIAARSIALSIRLSIGALWASRVRSSRVWRWAKLSCASAGAASSWAAAAAAAAAADRRLRRARLWVRRRP